MSKSITQVDDVEDPALQVHLYSLGIRLSTLHGPNVILALFSSTGIVTDDIGLDGVGIEQGKGFEDIAEWYRL